MSRRVRIGLVVLGAALAGSVVAGLAAAEVPEKINYQGLLTDPATGEPLVGGHEVVFRLYNVAVGGAELWNETQTLEADQQGVVSAVLGAKQPLDLGLGGALWLEVTVDGEVLSPRRELVSVPFALRAAAAENADSLAGRAVASFADSAHTHDGRYFTEADLATTGAINAPGNPVDWTKLKGVPAGFADGSDSTGGVGDGHSLDAADGSPTDAVYVDNDGDVGIGITNPLSRLHVEDPSDAGYTCAIRGIASSTGNGQQMAGVMGETRSSSTSNSGAGVMGSASSPTGSSAGVMGVASADQGVGVLGISEHASGEAYGVVGSSESPNGYAGYFVGARSYFSGRVGIGEADPQRKLHVEENSSADNATAILGIALSAAARGATGVRGDTYCADTVYVGSGVLGRAAGATSRSSGVTGFADGARGVGVDAIATHATGENYGIRASTGSSNGFGCHVYGPRNYFSGKIGVGTESPQSRLHIHEPEVATGNFLQMTNVNTGTTAFDGLSLALDPDRSCRLVNLENKTLGLGANGVVRMTIHPTGQVSIGSQDTTGHLTITQMYPRLVLQSAALHAGGGIDFYNSYGSDYRACGISWGSMPIIMTIGGENPLYITDDGRLGFESKVVNNLLDVTGPGATWGGVNSYTEVVGHFRTTGSGHTAVSIDAEENLDPILYLAENGKAYWDLRTDSDAAQKFELRYHGLGAKNNIVASVDTLGNLGLGGVPDTAYKLVIAGKAYATVGWRTPGSVAIGATDPGGYKLYVQGTAYSTGGWSSSDARLKDKIAPIAWALSKALTLRGVSFEWRREQFPDKGLPEGRHYGLVAQEVEEVLPEAVQTGPDGEKAVAYNEIIPVLVEALKAQEARIQALERQIDDLRAGATDGR